MELEVVMIDIEKNGVQWFSQWNLEDLVFDKQDCRLDDGHLLWEM